MVCLCCSCRFLFRLLPVQAQRESEQRETQLRQVLAARAAAPTSALEQLFLRQQLEHQAQQELALLQAHFPSAAAAAARMREEQELYTALLLRERADLASAAPAPVGLDELRLLSQQGSFHVSELVNAAIPPSVLEHLIRQRDAALRAAAAPPLGSANISAAELIELERARLIREMTSASAAAGPGRSSLLQSPAQGMFRGD